MNELFAFHKSNESLFTNVQAVNKIALVQGSENEFQGMIKLLSEEHIMYDLIIPSLLGSDRTPRKLEDYDLIILDDVADMSDELVATLDNYVEKGGRLLVSLKSLKPVKQVRLMRSGKSIPFKQNREWIEFIVPETGDFEMALCLY